MTNIILPV